MHPRSIVGAIGRQQGSPFTYLVMAIWLGTTIFWLVRMNRALAMFHGLFIIPALQVRAGDRPIVCVCVCVCVCVSSSLLTGYNVRFLCA